MIGYQEIVLSDGIFADNHTLNYQKIVKKLKELKKRLPLFCRKVALAIPDNAVISKVLQIDSALDSCEQEFAIYHAFSSQSPLAVEELCLDFVVSDKKAPSDPSSVNYQVYAARRELIDSRSSMLSKAGFSPVLFDMQMHGLLTIWQWVSRAQQRSNWMLVDVGLTQTVLCSGCAEPIPFYKDIPMGTRHFPGALCDEPEEANVVQRDDWAERLMRQIQLFIALPGSQPLAGIWLSGGGGAWPGLAERVTRYLQLPCEHFNPLLPFHSGGSRNLPPTHQCSRFSTATGLAIRGLNWLENGHAR